MRKKYIGKTCPYCKTPLVEGDTVVFCSVCDMPHHLSCWQDNQGCTTFGCTGSIKEIVGIDAKASASHGTSTQPEPAHTHAEQPEKPIETLYESKEMVFLSGVPLVLENAALIIDRTKDKLFARCTLRSITDDAINAALISISCHDVWGNMLGEPMEFQYLDLTTKRDSIFGQTDSIELADKTTRKIQVSVKKVLFADGTVASGDGVAFTMPAPVLLSTHLGSNELAAEYARETTPKAQFVPENGNDHWFCTCGSLNTCAEERCHHCGCSKDQLAAALDPEALNANMLRFAAEQQAAAEKAQAEQAERIRQAEEQVRLEKEQKEREIKAAQNSKRKKKIVCTLVISLLVAATLSCGTVFFGIPFVNYLTARKALEAGQYDTAYQAFVDLGNFLNSAGMAKQTLYDEAVEALANKQYDLAYQAFVNLGDFSDSAEMAKKALYEKAMDALANKQYDVASTTFKSLGDYLDSANMANESLYQKGKDALENGRYDNAIQIFQRLDNYKDSKDQAVEARYLKAAKYQSDKRYREAYLLYVALGSYKKSQNELLTTILLWEAASLGSSSTETAEEFVRTVKLDPTHHEMFYSTLLIFLNAHEDADYWCDWNAPIATRNTQIMLKMLPATYKDTAILKKLFNILDTYGNNYEELCRENKDLMRQCWSLPFVRNIAAHDDGILYFLEGSWTTYSGDYYLNFYQNDKGTTSCSYNLPWVAEPAGTKYYDIEDLILYWDGDNNNHLAKVYRLEIVDFDTIKVYCYKNNRTYTLYR